RPALDRRVVRPGRPARRARLLRPREPERLDARRRHVTIVPGLLRTARARRGRTLHRTASAGPGVHAAADRAPAGLARDPARDGARGRPRHGKREDREERMSTTDRTPQRGAAWTRREFVVTSLATGFAAAAAPFARAAVTTDAGGL